MSFTRRVPDYSIEINITKHHPPCRKFKLNNNMTIEKNRTKSLALAKIESNEKKWVLVFNFGATLVKAIAGCFIAYIILDSLQGIILSKPENIDALSRFIEKIRMGEALGYIIAGVMGIAYNRERNGKKRLIAEKGRMQKALEADDAHRSSSGLDGYGMAPEDNATRLGEAQ